MHFCMFFVKGAHIEIVGDLTTEGFLNALKSQTWYLQQNLF